MDIEEDDNNFDAAAIEAELGKLGMVPRDDAPAGTAAPQKPAATPEPQAEATPAAPTDGPARDEHGKFKAKEPAEPVKDGAEKPAETVKAPEAAPTPENADRLTEAPKSLSAAAREKWKDLPEWARSEFVKRESDFQRGVSRWDADQQTGSRLRKVFAPHAEDLRREGTTVEGAVQQLLASHNMIRGAQDPRERALILVNLARQYGVDLSPAISSGDPEKDRLALQNAQLASQARLGVQQQQQADHASLEEQVETFFADPAYPRATELRDVMALMLDSGKAASLADAYTRAEAMMPAAAASPAPQASQQPNPGQKVADARAAAVSVTGAPGASAPTGRPKAASLEEAMARAYDEVVSR